MSVPVLSVVVPVFREAEHIEHSLKTIHGVASKLGLAFELVCVDDGSPDATWAALIRVAQALPELRPVKLSRNFGKEGAMLAGLEASRGEAVVVMDSDLQHPPEVIPQMVELWQAGYKIVDGVKAQTNRGSRFAEFGARVFYSAFERLTGASLENSSDFKLLDRQVVHAYLALRERRLFFRAMISWMGYTRARVDFAVAERTAGTSKFPARKLAAMAMESIVSFSPLLMHGATCLGGLFLLFAAVLGGHTLYLKAIGGAVEGFATVILIQLVVGSTVLIALGVIGLYIARIHEELKARPRFLVESSDESTQSLRVFQQESAA